MTAVDGWRGFPGFYSAINEVDDHLGRQDIRLFASLIPSRDMLDDFTHCGIEAILRHVHGCQVGAIDDVDERVKTLHRGGAVVGAAASILATQNGLHSEAAVFLSLAFQNAEHRTGI